MMALRARRDSLCRAKADSSPSTRALYLHLHTAVRTESVETDPRKTSQEGAWDTVQAIGVDDRLYALTAIVSAQGLVLLIGR